MRSLAGFPVREVVWLEDEVADGPCASSLLLPDGWDPFPDFVEPDLVEPEPDFFEPDCPVTLPDESLSRGIPVNGL